MSEYRSGFSIGLRRVAMQMEQTQATLKNVMAMLDMGSERQANVCMYDCIAEIEKLAVLARSTPSLVEFHPKKEAFADLMAQQDFIQIGYTAQGWFAMALPSLLPAKRSGSVAYFKKTIYIALRKYFQDHAINMLTAGHVVAIRHCYHWSRPDREARDHDNVEVKALIDAIALYVLPDDSAYNCDHYYCSGKSDKDETQVFLVPITDFAQWFDLSQTAHLCNGLVHRLELY